MLVLDTVGSWFLGASKSSQTPGVINNVITVQQVRRIEYSKLKQSKVQFGVVGFLLRELKARFSLWLGVKLARLWAGAIIT
jgi:hypothetical protein